MIRRLFLLLAFLVFVPSVQAAEHVIGVYAKNDLAPYTLGNHQPTAFTLWYEIHTPGDTEYGYDSMSTAQTHDESFFTALNFTSTGWWTVNATASFYVWAEKNGVWSEYLVNVNVSRVSNVYQQGGDDIDFQVDYVMTPK